MSLRNVLNTAVEVGTAGVGVAATGVGTAAFFGQSWLVPALQILVSLVFLAMAVDKRLSNLHKAFNELRGEIEVLRGWVKGLPCRGTPNPRCGKCGSEVDE